MASQNMQKDITYYDLRTQDVKLEDITSSSYNARILRRLRDDLPLRMGDASSLIIADENYDDTNTFIVKEGDDWGWLGYFIGRNKKIRYLNLYYLPEEEDEVVALMEGVKHNRSVESIAISHEIEELSIIEHLAPFIIHNSNLKGIRLYNTNIGFDCARSLAVAVALKQRQQKSLTSIYLRDNNLSNEALAEIIDALSEYKQLESFYAEEAFIERNAKYYDMLAQIIDLKHVTSSEKNAEILHELRGNTYEKKALTVADYEDESDEYCKFFCPMEGDDWGWLGYFIGRNKQILDLRLYSLPEEEDKVDAFMEGIKHNRSIEELEFHHVIQGDSIIGKLASCIIDNSNLKELRVSDVDIGLECARSLASALKQRQQKSLTLFSLCFSNLSNEALAEIIDSLNGYKQLKSLLVEEVMIERNEKYYDMLAQIIDLNCITSCKKNAEILRKLRDHNYVWDKDSDEVLSVRNWDPEDDPNGETFCAEEGDDWGWLGYFIGKNRQIRWLSLEWLPEDEDDVDAFMDGLCRNQYIKRLEVIRCEIEFASLSSFILNNSNLEWLRLENVPIGLENARMLAMALHQRQHKSLTKFCLRGNNIEDEALGEITAALSDYSYLKSLDVSENMLIQSGGCNSLGAIIRSAALHLERLFLFENNFGDEDLQTLVAALTNTSSLRLLDVSCNPSITATGTRALSRLFCSACPLETLFLDKMNIGDDGAEALADGLMGNSTLKHLVITPDSAGITRAGWSAFLELLCDDSSINNTYQSNHTLEHIGDDYHFMSSPDGSSRFHSRGGFQGIPSHVALLLYVNKKYSPHPQVATKVKIANSHPDIPVEVFFHYKLKFLPFLVSWFEGLYLDSGHQRLFQERELSAVYKFIRGMPMLVVDSQVKLKCSCGRKRKYDE